MKILLIIPRYHYKNVPDYEYYFPLGLGYISSVIKKQGYDLNILNLNHYFGKIESIITHALNKSEYNIVCTGHIGIGYSVIESIINSVRKHSSCPKIILGGALITSEPLLIFESLKPDFGVIGEGEITILELLRTIEKNKDPLKVKGIIFKNKDGRSIITPQREEIEDLDSIPYPDFDGLGYDKQLKYQSSLSSPVLFDYPRTYPILCSRGCAFKCTFCYHCLGPKYRVRSIDNILNELKTAIPRYKINSIIIYDDLFSANKERLYDFCKRIKALIQEFPWEIRWMCQLSVHHINREMLNTLKDSGCYCISYGFESYSPIVLKSMKKPITPEQIDNAIKLTKEIGLIIQGNFIFGDIAETKETAKETLDYWKKNCSGQIKILFIQPYPGSEIYEHCIKKGIIKDKLKYIKDEMNHLTWFNMTQNMSDEDIVNLKKEILKYRKIYYPYISPLSIRKENSFIKNRHSVLVKCPFCKEKILYKNLPLENKIFYSIHLVCKNCLMYFYIANPLYKITVDHYNELEFLRKNYFKIRDKLLKKRV